jgi:hypothetical protein
MFETWVTVFTILHSIRTSEKTQFFILILFGKEYIFLKHFVMQFSVAFSCILSLISKFFFIAVCLEMSCYNSVEKEHTHCAVPFWIFSLLLEIFALYSYICFLNHTFLNIFYFSSLQFAGLKHSFFFLLLLDWVRFRTPVLSLIVIWCLNAVHFILSEFLNCEVMSVNTYLRLVHYRYLWKYEFNSSALIWIYSTPHFFQFISFEF